jgi:hypothetical protein
MASSASDGFNKFQNAFCTDGRRVLGGGADITIDTGISGDADNIAIVASRPRFGDPDSSPPFDNDGWFVRAAAVNQPTPIFSHWTLTVWVICATAGP